MVLQEVYSASLGNPNDPILKENVSALLPDDEKLLEWLKVMISQISGFFSQYSGFFNIQYPANRIPSIKSPLSVTKLIENKKKYCVPKKSCLLLYSVPSMAFGQDSLDIQ